MDTLLTSGQNLPGYWAGYCYQCAGGLLETRQRHLDSPLPY